MFRLSGGIGHQLFSFKMNSALISLKRQVFNSYTMAIFSFYKYQYMQNNFDNFITYVQHPNGPNIMDLPSIVENADSQVIGQGI